MRAIILTVIFRLSMTLLVVSPECYAGLNDELKDAFGGMINVTPAGAYETQRRGVIAGGGLSFRNPVIHPNLISLEPPSMKGGCGGIDLFGGSFSFINGAQLNLLLRSIAQAAAGYAFQLAVEGMCPTCSQVMTKLQKDIGFINGLMKNSCEAGKALVNMTPLKSWSEHRKSEFASLNVEHGYLEDFFDARENADEEPAKTMISHGAETEITGNIVYSALQTANVASWFTNGDDEMVRVLMSLTGTLIERKKDDDSDVTYDFRPPLIKVKDLIEGGKLKIYKCADAACLMVSSENTEEVEVTGLRKRVRTMIWGTGECASCTGGIIRKMSIREGGEGFTSAEKKFIEATSPGAYGLLRRLGAEKHTAGLMANTMIDYSAVELASRMTNEMFDTVEYAVANTGVTLDSAMLTVMTGIRNQIRDERAVTGQSLQGIDALLTTHHRIIDSLRRPGFNRTH